MVDGQLDNHTHYIFLVFRLPSQTVGTSVAEWCLGTLPHGRLAGSSVLFLPQLDMEESPVIIWSHGRNNLKISPNILLSIGNGLKHKQVIELLPEESSHSSTFAQTVCQLPH